MARLKVSGVEMVDGQLNRLGRDMVRRIVEAGAAAAVQEMRGNIRAKSHIRTGDMLDAVGTNEYREFLGGGSVDVYPQGDDSRGIRNAMKAFVINYGRGGTRKRGKMGDKFITGNEAKTEQAVSEAMQAEADRLIAEI